LPLVHEAVDFYQRATQLDPNFAVAWARLSRVNEWLYFNYDDRPARGDAAKHALANAQKLQPNLPEILLALGYYQYGVLSDYEAAKTTFERVSKMLPGSSEVPMALALIARRQGHQDQSIAYFDQALALDPRNVELLMRAASTYSMLRQFPTALKLLDRILDVTPNELDAMATKAKIYQAQGNLPEAAKLLSGINEQTPNGTIFQRKIDQLLYERNYGEAIRLLQARLTQFPQNYASELEKATAQTNLAWVQRLAGDAAGAKVTAEQALNTFEQLSRNQPENPLSAAWLSQVYAVTGQKDSALQAAERAITLMPRAKEPTFGPPYEENLAVIQMLVGENSPAISTLAQLLQTPYLSNFYEPAPITRALLRLDPMWDPLRGDPAFQKLCEEK
jgi:serine/threonine-protein kinase